MASSSKFQLPALDIPSQSLTAGTNIPPPPPSPPRTKSPAQIFSASSNSSRDQRRPSQPLKTAYSNQRLRDLSPGAAPSPTDSPNPLRSHPTSSHSLARKFSGSPLVGAGDENNSNGFPHNSSEAKTGNNASHQHQPSSVKRVPTNSSVANSSSTTTTSPPHKRPLSVRKLLSLRALNSAFGGSRHGDSGSRSATPGPGSSSSMYGNSSGKKSSDNLSLFSFARPGSSMGGGGSEFGGSEHGSGGAGGKQPTLRKRRSSAFWGRRGSTFLGLAVEEERGEGDRMDVDGAGKENIRQGTPPPTLPEVSSLEKGVKEEDGGFLGGGEMFKDIR